jgi:hypothetical protein
MDIGTLRRYLPRLNSKSDGENRRAMDHALKSIPGATYKYIIGNQKPNTKEYTFEELTKLKLRKAKYNEVIVVVKYKNHPNNGGNKPTRNRIKNMNSDAFCTGFHFYTIAEANKLIDHKGSLRGRKHNTTSTVGDNTPQCSNEVSADDYCDYPADNANADETINGLPEAATAISRNTPLPGKDNYFGINEDKYEQLLLVTLPDGRTILNDGRIILQDGSVVLHDGSIVPLSDWSLLPDGSMLLSDGRTILPGGYYYHPGCNGTPREHSIIEDGSIALPDGRTIFPDGRIMHPDGSITFTNGWTSKPVRTRKKQ